MYPDLPSPDSAITPDVLDGLYMQNGKAVHLWTDANNGSRWVKDADGLSEARKVGP